MTIQELTRRKKRLLFDIACLGPYSVSATASKRRELRQVTRDINHLTGSV